MSPIGDHICHCQGCNCDTTPWDMPITQSIAEESAQKFTEAVEAWGRGEITTDDLYSVIVMKTPLSTITKPKKIVRAVDIAVGALILLTFGVLLFGGSGSPWIYIAVGLAAVTFALTLTAIIT